MKGSLYSGEASSEVSLHKLMDARLRNVFDRDLSPELVLCHWC